MTVAIVPQPLPERPGRTLLERLREVVRPEFGTEVIRVAADDPVFGRGACDVDACRRPAWTRRLCQAHYLRWRRDGRPDHQQFIATTGSIAESARAASIGTFDLTALRPQARLEVAYVIQCRQDDRAQRLLGATVRHLVGLLAEADVDSLLDRPLPAWLDRITARGWVVPSRTIGLVRYAWRRLTGLTENLDANSEFARDLWRAEVLGIHTVKGPRQIHFDNVVQPWLREPVKRYARFRLATGKAFASVDIDVRAVRWLSRFSPRSTPTSAGHASSRGQWSSTTCPGWSASAWPGTPPPRCWSVCAAFSRPAGDTAGSPDYPPPQRSTSTSCLAARSRCRGSYPSSS